jgi:hypothetical protein
MNIDLDPITDLAAAIRELTAALTKQNAGQCPSIWETNLLGTVTWDSCQYAAGHTGLHANNQNGKSHWADNTPGARNLGADDHGTPPCGAIRDEAWGPGAVDGKPSDHPCVLRHGHTTRHTDRDGDRW